ncbi:MAG: glycerophosphodiester phosphodiesterase [Clostridia bacterium]|nr:glycerophosphodiester phosphodiesterase [Clostridia bacterium]
MKKKTRVILVACATAVIGSAALLAGYTVLKHKNVALPEEFTITAHTGCENSADNSLEAIRLGYISGADIVEFDLNFNSEGIPVLSHDEPAAGVVTLEEAFRSLTEYEGLRINIDVKKADDLEAVVSLSEKYGLRDRIFYTGIEEAKVAAVQSQTPDVMYYLNADVDKTKSTDREYLLSLAEKVESSGAVGINMWYGACSKELVSLFRERGLLVSIWTVNSELSMLKMLELAPDNITTRNPSRLKELVINKTNK